MADVFSRRKRSEVMSRIRGRGNKATEVFLAKLFRRQGIAGWRRHSRLPGTPDFAFRSKHVAVFVDGCFWHGCKPCSKGRAPAHNAPYWAAKLVANKKRDQRAGRKLRTMGWKVVRIWEHTLEKHPDIALEKICRHLGH